MMTGSSAATTAVWIRASGRRPCAAAHVGGGDGERGRAVGDLRRGAGGDHAVRPERGLQLAELLQRGVPADALVGGELAAVGEPAPARSRRRTAPASCAAAACAWLASANSSSWAREKPHRWAIISAPTPWLNGTGSSSAKPVDAAVARAHQPVRTHRRRPTLEPIGTRLIDSTPPATTRSAWPDSTVGGGEVQRLLAGAALPVERGAGHRLGPAGGEHGVAADVPRLLADLGDAAPDDVVDVGRVEPGALGERAQHVRRQVDRVDAGEAARCAARPGCAPRRR